MGLEAIEVTIQEYMLASEHIKPSAAIQLLTRNHLPYQQAPICMQQHQHNQMHQELRCLQSHMHSLIAKSHLHSLIALRKVPQFICNKLRGKLPDLTRFMEQHSIRTSLQEKKMTALQLKARKPKASSD